MLQTLPFKLGYMKPLYALLMALLPLCSLAQWCPTDPPLNPYLADSPWPTYHRNNYRQASTCLAGPLPGDSLRIKYKSNIRGGTSPWVYLSEPYPNGERVLLQSNATHVFKFIDNGADIITVDSLRIDFDPITSFGWNFLLAKNKIWYTFDPKYDPEDEAYTRLFKLTDADTTDPYSDIIVLDTFDFGEWGVNKTQHFAFNYDGQIVFNSDNDTDSLYATVGVISQDFVLLDTLRYRTTADEITSHNAFPVDEFNNFYLTTNKRLIKFKWDGTELGIDWEAPYDFVGDGPTGTFAEGSGTTPTLLGWGQGNDKLVVMSDGHAQNKMVAFWRELPPGWTGIPGMDIHFADTITLPAARSFSNTFQSIENSPTAFGYDIGIAQFNGFLGYDCDNFKGVQKVHWDTLTNQFEIAWVNDSINLNGVLTYSQGSNMVYSSGKEADCNYYYYGLDWETGERKLRLLLGPEGTFLDDPFYDAGNGSVIDEEGSIYFPGGASLVKLEIVPQATNLNPAVAPVNRLVVYPNPTSDWIMIDEAQSFSSFRLFNQQGQEVGNWSTLKEGIDLGSYPAGFYHLQAIKDQQVWSTSRILRR